MLDEPYCTCLTWAFFNSCMIYNGKFFFLSLPETERWRPSPAPFSSLSGLLNKSLTSADKSLPAMNFSGLSTVDSFVFDGLAAARRKHPEA